MKVAPKTLWSAVVAAGLAGLIMTALARAQTPATVAPSGPPPTKLAVVNIVDLFENLDEKKAADAEIGTMKDAYEAQDRKKQATIDLAVDNLDKTYKRGTPAYRAAQEDILRISMEKEVDKQVNQQKLIMELRLRTVDLYRKINEAVESYALTNGIALVFVADNSSVEGARTPEQVQAMVTVRKILYVHSSYDITKNILQKMNTDYQLAPRSTPKATTPTSRP